MLQNWQVKTFPERTVTRNLQKKSLPRVKGTSVLLSGVVSNSSTMWTSSPVREINYVNSIYIVEAYPP